MPPNIFVYNKLPNKQQKWNEHFADSSFPLVNNPSETLAGEENISDLTKSILNLAYQWKPLRWTVLFQNQNHFKIEFFVLQFSIQVKII